MQIHRKIGLVLGVAAIIMFFIGVYGFTTYIPNRLLSKVAMASFMLWFPILMTGIILISIKTKKTD